MLSLNITVCRCITHYQLIIIISCWLALKLNLKWQDALRSDSNSFRIPYYRYKLLIRIKISENGISQQCGQCFLQKWL